MFEEAMFEEETMGDCRRRQGHRLLQKKKKNVEKDDPLAVKTARTMPIWLGYLKAEEREAMHLDSTRMCFRHAGAFASESRGIVGREGSRHVSRVAVECQSMAQLEIDACRKFNRVPSAEFGCFGQRTGPGSSSQSQPIEQGGYRQSRMDMVPALSVEISHILVDSDITT